MEPKVSLLYHTHKISITIPYSEPGESGPNCHTLKSILILCCYLHLVSQAFSTPLFGQPNHILLTVINEEICKFLQLPLTSSLLKSKVVPMLN